MLCMSVSAALNEQAEIGDGVVFYVSLVHMWR